MFAILFDFKKEIFVDPICSGAKKNTEKKVMCFSLSVKDALEANVFITNEALADTGWTTEQQTAMETSVEKEKMMENLTGNDGKPLWRMRKL